MGKELSKEIKDNEYYVRCSLALDVHLKQATLDVLHNSNNVPGYQGLPEDPDDLHKELLKFFTAKKIKKLEGKGVLKPDQKLLLFPVNQKPVSNTFDITLIVLTIKTCLKLPNNLSQAIDDARELRNNFKHATLEQFKTKLQFNIKWNEIPIEL